MKYVVEIETSKDLDLSLYEIYMDIKKRRYLKGLEPPKEKTRVDCECDTDTKYSVN